MKRHRGWAVWVSSLFALVFCAAAASPAIGLKGTTAYTCRPEPKPTITTKGFEDEHCTKAVEGTGVKFVHEEVKPGTSTKVEILSSETGGAIAHPKLKAVLAGVEVELEIKQFHSCLGKAVLENKENGSKQMEASGSNCGKFTGGIVQKPSTKCRVKGSNFSLTEGGKVQTAVEFNAKKEEEMSVSFVAGTNKELTSFELEQCPSPYEELNNKLFSVIGNARANVTAEAGKLDGPTLRFTTEQTGKTLTISGQKAEFEATMTMRKAPEGEKEENPLALTTTTK